MLHFEKFDRTQDWDDNTSETVLCGGMGEELGGLGWGCMGVGERGEAEFNIVMVMCMSVVVWRGWGLGWRRDLERGLWR